MNTPTTTLLDDTLRCIALSGHSVEQIVFIGTESGYSLSWGEFASMIAEHPHIGDVASGHQVFEGSNDLFRIHEFFGLVRFGPEHPATGITDS